MCSRSVDWKGKLDLSKRDALREPTAFLNEQRWVRREDFIRKARPCVKVIIHVLVGTLEKKSYICVKEVYFEIQLPPLKIESKVREQVFISIILVLVLK